LASRSFELEATPDPATVESTRQTFYRCPAFLHCLYNSVSCFDSLLAADLQAI
jgi:hypothetical protein